MLDSMPHEMQTKQAPAQLAIHAHMGPPFLTMPLLTKFLRIPPKFPHIYQIDPKPTPNRPQIDPKLIPNRPQIDPKLTPNRAQIDPTSTQIDPRPTPNRPNIDPTSTQHLPQINGFFVRKRCCQERYPTYECWQRAWSFRP